MESLRDRYPDVLAGPRRSGKTTKLLLRANETGIPILVHNEAMKRHIRWTAKQMDLKNVKVITLHDLKCNKVERVIVDEFQSLLEQMLRTRIDTMSVSTYELVELHEIPLGPFEINELHDAIDVGNLTVKLTVDTSEFEERFKRVKLMLNEVGATAAMAADNLSKAIEDIKSTASRL